MPSSRRRIDLDGVRRHLRDHAFERSAGRVGVELEWLAAPASDPTRACDFSTVLTASDVALPNGSRATFEPGGQPELSSRPFPTVGAFLVIVVETIGAACVILGIFTRPWALCMMLEMAVAMLVQLHGGHNIELEGLLFAGALTLVALGDGPLSIAIRFKRPPA